MASSTAGPSSLAFSPVIIQHDHAEEVEDGKQFSTFRVTEPRSRRSSAYADLVIPDEYDEFIDPRLKDYPVPLVAKTVDLNNDPTEPILTFRFWVLSTFWVVVGCGASAFYYFKPFDQTFSSYVVQLLAWGMGQAMYEWLPTRQFNTFGFRWSMNPGKWNAKEHALVVVAFWGSSHTAYGLGPLSAMEIYYGRRIDAIWGILFLITSQLIGYGFTGIFRDILVRPPKMYYPGILPNIALFNAMHKNPAMTKNSLAFFSYVATAAFCWHWFPELIFPLLASLPLLCWMGHGNPIAYVLGSGTYGFGILNLTFDWNYISGLLQPMYTPLWANTTQFAGIFFAVWFLYPILYYTDTFSAQDFQAMSSDTFDSNGTSYNITRVLTPTFQLNQTAMDEYSTPHWSVSYVFYFFWGFASSTGAMLYAILWYGQDAYQAVKNAFQSRREEYEDPYLDLMSIHPRVPHWWYLLLLGVCTALAIGTLYGGDLALPWWGFILISLISLLFTFPNGILWGVANQQVGMTFLSEVISGWLFAGKPLAVLTSLTYSRQILEQNLNLTNDYKFGFYMKIPEREMFVAQVYGTLLGPFINYGMMRVIIDRIGKETLKGATEHSVTWLALKTRDFYSLSVLWGVIGPAKFFGSGSDYHWLYYGFLLGPLTVFCVWTVQCARPHWDLERYCNPTLFFYGMTLFPRYTTTNFFTAVLVSWIFMGYIYRYHPVWWRKWHYLLAIGIDCGTQVMQTILVFTVNLPNASFPTWWGNDARFPDKCFPPNAKLPPAMRRT
ncbi:isp4 protein [Polychaeton citri CBS 116435]|uniref:Isp4 protein n=1 Tax=Polychaeton citri CBS 116435 TaxID=1314669 RepID=A0A9P4Q4B1_9PEZI|nr:isp4 protein [Polychaeton citri CBS 116435]